MKIVEADGFEFHFTDALDAFVFDEKDSTKPTFHGAPMKGVDIVAEFANAYVYVEVKDYNDPSIYAQQNKFNWLKDYLKYKFRDSYLYRHAEHKVDKPVRYICLTTFDNALNSLMQKSLKLELPVGIVSPRWIQALALSCHVVNMDKWNEKFQKWPVTRVTPATPNRP